MTEQRDQSVLSNPIKIPLINFWIERKADLLTIAAFALASLTALAQVYFFLQGPVVYLAPPEQVLFNFEPIRGAPGHDMQLRIAARMSYVNSGQAGNNAVLWKESISLVVNGSKRIQHWHSEQQFTDLDNNGILEQKFVGEAQPRPINAGGSLSREVYFSPFPVRCRNEQNCDVNQNFVFESEVLPWIFEQQSITLTFKFELHGQKSPDPIQCVVDVDDRVKLDLLRFGWTAPPCWPVEDKRSVLSLLLGGFPPSGDVP